MKKIIIALMVVLFSLCAVNLVLDTNIPTIYAVFIAFCVATLLYATEVLNSVNEQKQLLLKLIKSYKNLNIEISGTFKSTFNNESNGEPDNNANQLISFNDVVADELMFLKHIIMLIHYKTDKNKNSVPSDFSALEWKYRCLRYAAISTSLLESNGYTIEKSCAILILNTDGHGKYGLESPLDELTLRTLKSEKQTEIFVGMILPIHIYESDIIDPCIARVAKIIYIREPKYYSYDTIIISLEINLNSYYEHDSYEFADKSNFITRDMEIPFYSSHHGVIWNKIKETD